jgi:hypothetical protein
MSISTLTTSSNKKFTLNNRIKHYKLVSSYISKHLKEDPNNCINVKDNLIKIGTNIVLDNRIGSKSVWGLAFLSHYIIQNSNKLIFATKIVDLSKNNNLLEYNILKFLTLLNVEKQICPHFPFCYGALKCDDFSHTLIKKKIDLGKLKNKKLIFIFSELANNNLKHLLKFNNNQKILLNAIVQIMISIMFFNKYTKSFHKDGHSGNFLYHEITPGGYFHYVINGVDYYIENLGYLWVIWDFGLIIPFSTIDYDSSTSPKFKYYNSLPINYDFIKTLSSIKKRNKNEHIVENINSILFAIRTYDYTYNLNKMPELINKVLQSLQQYTNNSLITSNPSKIINKKPFLF